MTSEEMKRHCYNVLKDAEVEEVIPNDYIRFWTGTPIREGAFMKVVALLEKLGSIAIPDLMKVLMEQRYH